VARDEEYPNLGCSSEALAQVSAASSEADHLSPRRLCFPRQQQRSLVVWLTDFAETGATPEVIECTTAIARRHLVVFGIMAQTELRSLVATRPDTVTNMYRYSAAWKSCSGATSY